MFKSQVSYDAALHSPSISVTRHVLHTVHVLRIDAGPGMHLATTVASQWSGQQQQLPVYSQ